MSALLAWLDGLSTFSFMMLLLILFAGCQAFFAWLDNDG